MKILVTGGLGFIGSRYIQEMEAQGHECLAFDRPQHDILDNVDFRIALDGCDMCVHFAAMADVTVCIRELFNTFNVNIRGTFEVARICAEEKKPLIFISTCCVYGNSKDEICYEDTTQPQAAEPYATSKVAGEAIIKGTPHLDYSILRIGTVYGPGQRDALFTGICFNHVRDGKKVYIDGDGLQTRQLVYIDDLVEGIVRATVKFEKIKGETINLCGVEHTSAINTLDTVELITGKKVEREHREQRYGQTFKEDISIEKARDLLGWWPTRTFLVGMKETYEKDERYR